jgi:hypothetical protein
LLGLELRWKALPERRAVAWLLVYVLVFLSVMTLGAKKLDRYMLPALLLLDLTAGLGLWRIASLVGVLITRSRPLTPPADDLANAARPASRRRVDRWLTFALLGVGAIGQASLLLLAEPYPIAAYNPIAGGADRAGRIIMLGWGEGLEQVTAYLNSQPDPAHQIVATNYIHVVRPRLSGTSIPINLYFDNEPEHPLPTPDYVVLYVNSVQRRQIPPIARRAIQAGPPAFIARVNGEAYAWVYAVPSSEPRITAPVPTDDSSEKEDN